jgi:hypothetical protein
MGLLIIGGFILSGCKESTDEFNLKESIKNKDIIIVNKNKDIGQVLQGQVKIYNHDKLNEFINKARSGENT